MPRGRLRMPALSLPPAPAGSVVAPLAAALAEVLLLLVTVEAALLMLPATIRWADFARTAHLRALAPLLLLVVVVLWWLEHRQHRAEQGPAARWFGAALLAVAATTALATALSVAPQVGLWGERRETTGLLTVLSWTIVAGCAATVIRTWVQVERLLFVLLLASFAAAWYGLIQRHAWDALAPYIVETVIDGSTLGNPVFLGSLLALTLPVGLAWCWAVTRPAEQQDARRDAAPRVRRGPGRGTARWRWLLAALGCQALFALWLVVGRDRADGGWFLPPVLVGFVWLAWSAHTAQAAPGAWRASRLALVGVCVFVALALGLAILGTQARGAILGGSVGVAFFALWLARPAWRRRMAMTVPPAGMLAAVVSVVIGPALVAVLPTVAGGAPLVSRLTSVESRQHVWQMAMRLLGDPPVLLREAGDSAPLRLVVGYGPDTVRFVSEPVYPQSVRSLEAGAFINDVHNDLLQHLLTVGLLGTVAWAALLASVAWAARAAYRRADERQRILLGGLLAGLAGYAVEQMVGPAYPPVRTLAWLLAGAIVGLARGPAGPSQAPARVAAASGDLTARPSLWWPLAFAALTFAAALALPPASLDHLERTATGWWTWSLVGIGGMALALVPRAQRRISGGVVLAGVVFLVGGALWGSQALRPLVAERLHSASAGAKLAGDIGASAGLASDARAVWPIDERYDFDFGMALIQVAGAQRGRLPQRLPQPAPPPEPFEPFHLTRARPEEQLDWGMWLVERAAERQPLEFEYPLGRAQTYRQLAELLGSEEARAEARRALAVAQRLSPTHPRVVALARQMGGP